MQATMGNGDGNVPILKQIGILDMKGIDQLKRIYSADGLSLTISTCGGNTEPKIITHIVSQNVSVRKYNVDTERLVKVLREHKEKIKITNKQLAEKLDIPVTQIEHYFRQDDSFAIPEPSIWLNFKKILRIETNEFDESIMTFEEKEGIYEKANRVYDDEGIAPTLTQQEEKIKSNYRIRKLTPLECWRLMGFDDEDFDKAQAVPTSNTQLYKQAR